MRTPAFPARFPANTVPESTPCESAGLRVGNTQRSQARARICIAPGRDEQAACRATDFVDCRPVTSAACGLLHVGEQLISAPCKLVLTPVVAAALGGGLGALTGFSAGASVVALIGIALTDPSGIGAVGRRTDAGDDRPGTAQHCFERGVRYAVVAPALVVGVPALLALSLATGAVGGVVGAAVGSVSGAAIGLAEGYQASWDGRWPGRPLLDRVYSR